MRSGFNVQVQCQLLFFEICLVYQAIYGFAVKPSYCRSQQSMSILSLFILSTKRTPRDVIRIFFYIYSTGLQTLITSVTWASINQSGSFWLFGGCHPFDERTNPRLLLYSERNWPKTGSNPIVVVLYFQSDRFCLRLVNRQLFCRRLFTPRERIMTGWRGERGEQGEQGA